MEEVPRRTSLAPLASPDCILRKLPQGMVTRACKGVLKVSVCKKPLVFVYLKGVMYAYRSPYRPPTGPCKVRLRARLQVTN